MPEVAVALMEAGVPVGDASRKTLLRSVSASVALDVIQVLMTRMYSSEARSYPETRKEVTKLLTSQVKAAVTAMSDAESVKRSVVAMAKYKKAR